MTPQWWAAAVGAFTAGAVTGFWPLYFAALLIQLAAAAFLDMEIR